MAWLPSGGDASKLAAAMDRPGDRGILLVNLGTPDAPETVAVRRFLREFLSDPRVIDTSPLGRWILVNLIVAPFRSPKSAAAYAKVWLPQGSPLLVHGRALLAALRERLGDVPVELGMRYGSPSIADGLRRLHALGCRSIDVLPLYPQYADSSTGSSIAKVREEAERLWQPPSLRFVESFHDDPGFIDAFATIGRPVLDELAPDHVLFSYHGLPERHIRNLDPTGTHCLATPTCCDTAVAANRRCYRAHCFSTTRALVRALALPPQTWSIAFQSRLGRDPWLAPSTPERLDALARAGVKRLAVFCPAFVADCLETLEEIQIRAAEQFRAAGGERLVLVPSLNASARWVDAVVGLLALASEQPAVPAPTR